VDWRDQRIVMVKAKTERCLKMVEGIVNAKRKINDYNLLLAVACLAAFCHSAFAGEPTNRNRQPEADSFYQWTKPRETVPAGKLLRQEEFRLPPFYRARAWRMLYMTRDYAGRPIVSSGMVVLSGYAPKKTHQRNIVAWAHPTTGIAQGCAPSLHKRPTATISGLNELISGGYIIAATDYPGLGTVGPVGYMVGVGQGQAAIDSVRAARQIPSVGGGNQYALWGYSQGGHAALFGAKLSSHYAPELKLVGVAAVAPPTNLSAFLNDVNSTFSGRVVAAITLQSWSQKYGVPLPAILGKSKANAIKHLSGNCFDTIEGQLALLTAPNPLDQQLSSSEITKFAPWRQLIRQNSVDVFPSQIPAFIAQGDADDLVSHDETLQFIQRQCALGTRIAYLKLAGKGHSQSGRAANREAISWINDRFNRIPAPDSCGNPEINALRPLANRLEKRP
jgi:Secretory lipase